MHDLRSDIPLNILTSDVLVPVYGAYEYLVVSSVGLKRFNLLVSSSSSRAGMSSLGCVISFCWYLVLQLVISALTVGICRSVCRIAFGTYRGALAIDLRILFWNICSISMLGITCSTPQTNTRITKTICSQYHGMTKQTRRNVCIWFKWGEQRVASKPPTRTLDITITSNIELFNNVNRRLS